MRRILSAAIVLTLLAFPVWAADETDTQTSAVGGTMPELCQIAISGDLTALLTLAQDGTGETSYDAGFVESAADATILTLDANKAWQLSVKYNAVWSCPGAYDKAETDLLIMISNSPTGTIQDSFDANHVVTASNVVMLSHTAGVSDNTVNIQTRVLLDWTQDIPGVYSITLTYTMETTT